VRPPNLPFQALPSFKIQSGIPDRFPGDDRILRLRSGSSTLVIPSFVTSLDRSALSKLVI
jgi:hypothetical protein